MATPFAEQETNTVNKPVRFPTFRKADAPETTFAQPDTSFGPVTRGLDVGKPNVAQSPLFQQASKTASDQLGGEVEGFEQQAQIARETAKAVQAQTAKAKREQLIQSGIRDTGTYVGEGLIQTEEDNRREMLDLERRLAVNRGELSAQQTAAGQTAAASLLGIASGANAVQQQIASQERIASADVNYREKQLAEEGRQFDLENDFKKYALDRGYTEAEAERAWQEKQNQQKMVSAEKIAFADLNLREKQLTEEGRQFDQEDAFKRYALESGYTEAEAERAWQATQTQKHIDSAEKIAFAELSVKELALAQEGKQFTDRLAFDRYATDKGYSEQEKQRAWQAIQNANQLSSQERIAFAELDQRDRALAQNGMQFTDRLEFDKYALQQGYDQAAIERTWQAVQNEQKLQAQERIAGMEIASREKIAADQNLIQQQGLSLQEAELYGYTDANGNHIAGAAERAAAQLGLQERSLELQQKELFGYTDEQGVYHKGKYDLMNDAEKRAADELYGFQVKDENGNTIGAVPGRLQLEADRVDIDRQGLDLQEAQVFGYDKEDGTHVDGQMDLQMKQFGLQEKTYDDNRIAMFGGVGPNGQEIKGQLQIDAERLGLEADSLQLQKEELFGYTDENGTFHKGKYDLLSDEQKRAADELYGYTDPITGETTPGKWDQIKETMNLQNEFDLKKMQEQYGYEEALQKLSGDINLALQNDDQEHAMSLLNTQQKFTAEQAALDRKLDWARVELEKAGFDYTIIKDQIESGAIGPDAAIEFTKAILEERGIEYTPPDPNAIYDELDRDFRVQQYQFALTHPELAEYNADGTFKGLKDEGAELFQSYLNTSYYGPDGEPSIGGVKIHTSNTYVPGDIFFADGDLFKVKEDGGRDSLTTGDILSTLRGADNPNSQNNTIYQQILSSTPAPSIAIDNIHTNSIGGVPAEGSIVKVGNRLMMITKGVYYEKSGRNHDAFKIMDIGTGTERTFTGLTDRDSVSNLGSWAVEMENL